MQVFVSGPDLLARTRVEAAARAAGHDVISRNRPPGPDDPVPDMLVADLDAPGAIEALEALRAAHPGLAVSGFAFHVNTAVLARAKAAGIAVFPHGGDPAAIFA